MTNNTSTFTPSTQILEAGEKAQALADAGKPLARFFSPEIQETVEGVQKIANALNSTGEALRHFGFDEDESYSSDFTSEPQVIGEAGFDTGYIFDPNQEANQAVTGSIVSALDPQLDPSQAGALA